MQTITVMGRGITAAPSSATLNGQPLKADQIVFSAANGQGSYSFENLALPLNAVINLQWK